MYSVRFAVIVLFLSLCSCIQSDMGDYLRAVGKYNVAAPEKIASDSAEVYQLDGCCFLKVPVYYPQVATRGMFRPVMPIGGWAHPLIPAREAVYLTLPDAESLHEYYARPRYEHTKSDYIFVKLDNKHLGLNSTSPAAQECTAAGLMPDVVSAADFDYDRASLCALPALKQKPYIEVPHGNKIYGTRRTLCNYMLMPVTCCAYLADIPVSACLTLGYGVCHGVYLLLW